MTEKQLPNPEAGLPQETTRLVGDQIMKVTMLPAVDAEVVREIDNAYINSRRITDEAHSGLIKHSKVGAISTGRKRPTTGGPTTGSNYS